MPEEIIEIYTDGSCNKEYQVGAWAALIFYQGKKILLEGIHKNTTHNRMELMAVIRAINYTNKQKFVFDKFRVYTDSQYVAGIPLRAYKLTARDFTTKQGKDIRNKDLVKTFLRLIQDMNIEFIKVKAHQKTTATINYNREVDQQVRKRVRQQVNAMK